MPAGTQQNSPTIHTTQHENIGTSAKFLHILLQNEMHQYFMYSQ